MQLAVQVLTEGDVSNVVPNSGVCVLQLQRRLPVAEQHLRGCVAGSPTLLELLRTEQAAYSTRFRGFIFLFTVRCNITEYNQLLITANTILTITNYKH